MATSIFPAVPPHVWNGAHIRVSGGQRSCQAWTSRSWRGAGQTSSLGGVSVSVGPRPAHHLVCSQHRGRVSPMQPQRGAYRPPPYVAGAVGTRAGLGTSTPATAGPASPLRQASLPPCLGVGGLG